MWYQLHYLLPSWTCLSIKSILQTQPWYQFRITPFLFPPSLPFLFSSCSFSWWLLFKTVMWHHLYFVFTYSYAILIGKDLCECWNIIIKFSYIFHPETSSFFSVNFPLFILLFMLSVLQYFPFPCTLLRNILDFWDHDIMS